MMARAYYNEIDRDAAHVLRCLVADGLIAPGDVDDRSIKDVEPDDLIGYTQAHFFAGAGLWSVAARLAGWPDDRPLWTGSCPCQPFSAAGKGLGTDDPRHLWPDFFRLIRARRPPVIMGEQVAGAPGYGWFDGVRADLAREGFASRPADIPACSVDAPHIRQRIYWIAVDDVERDGRGAGRGDNAGHDGRLIGATDRLATLAMANAHGPRSSALGRDVGEVGRLQASQCGAEDHASLPWRGNDPAVHYMEHAARLGRREGRPEPELRSGRAAPAGADASGVPLGDAFGSRLEGQRGHGDGRGGWPGQAGSASSPDGRNGTAWSGSDWLVCHDGKARRTEPGIRLLVDGMAGRVPAWRLAGNSISPVLAAEVISAYLDMERYAA